VSDFAPYLPNPLYQIVEPIFAALLLDYSSRLAKGREIRGDSCSAGKSSSIPSGPRLRHSPLRYEIALGLCRQKTSLQMDMCACRVHGRTDPLDLGVNQRSDTLRSGSRKAVSARFSPSPTCCHQDPTRLRPAHRPPPIPQTACR